MQKQSTPWYVWVFLLGGIWLAAGRPGIDSISLPSLNSKVTQATYVYEKDDNNVPPGVSAGLQKLNAQGILATVFEEDTVDGSGETPEQYKIARAAKAGKEPVLVVQAAAKVTKVVKIPNTETDVTEAAK